MVYRRAIAGLNVEGLKKKRAGYQSAEVYAGLTQAKCARESVQV
ncbi:putative transposase [Shigella sonnei str. Moseley]|nr:putative transposase [Shigella sonnei str. Moseley]ODQ05761.1 transposase [Shigella sp. FC1544]ODQ06554.1 transposase [Shigella sp. FC1544]ODQ06690.1 transposase [Shigella sp. FC1544]OEG31163.1 transposase [Shigella sp. FC2117]